MTDYIITTNQGITLIKYISPSSYHLFLTDVKTFYLSYIRGLKSRDPLPGAIDDRRPLTLGSLVDGYIKMYLCKSLFGESSGWQQYNNEPKTANEPRQAEVIPHAKLVFMDYIKNGFFNALLKEMENSISPPKFEFELYNQVTHKGESVPMKGYPDLYFTTKDGTLVIYDWKVNGFYGASTTSPVQGYIGHGVNIHAQSPHKTAAMTTKSGITVNTNMISKREWMNQLTIYSWLLGNPVGDENCILGIDQFVCNPPKISVARHRSFPHTEFQLKLFEDIKVTYRKVTETSWQAEQEALYGDIADAHDGSPMWNYFMSIASEYRGLPSL